MSAADHERQLWEASEQFIRGEISSERLDQIELSDKLSRDDATDAIGLQSMRWFFIVFVCLMTIFLIIFALIVLIVTHNAFALTILAGLAPSSSVLLRIFRYYFPENERTYEIEAIRLQQKMRRKHHHSA